MKFLIVMLIFVAAGAYIIHHDGFNVKAGIISVILAAGIVAIMLFGDAKTAKTLLAGLTVLIMVYDILAIMNPTKKAKNKAIESKEKEDAARAEFLAAKAAEAEGSDAESENESDAESDN